MKRRRTIEVRRAAVGHLRALLRIVQEPRWASPILVLFGICSSAAEMIGITLVILFFYSATGGIVNSDVSVGLLGRVFKFIQPWFDSSPQVAGVVFVLILLRGALAFANSVINAHVTEMISEKVRNLIHQRYLRASYAAIRRHDQAYLMEVIGTESFLVASAYERLTQVAVSLCSVFVFASFLLVLSWPIAVAAVLGIALMSVLSRQLANSAQYHGQRSKAAHQGLHDQMLMTIEGLRTIRAYGQEARHHGNFVRLSSDARRATFSLLRLAALIHPLTEIGYLGILCVIIVGGTFWHQGFATTLATVALLYRLQPFTRKIETDLLFLAQIEPQLKSVLTVLQSDIEPDRSDSGRPLRSMSKGIRFERVTFRYEEDAAPALDDVSFEIPAGEATAIVGSSGAGKTTIINLLLGLYRPSSGTIWIDDLRLDEARRADWLGQLAVAGQDVELVEGTVIDNLRMAATEATAEQVAEAARHAGISEFIESLPERYDTWIGQQGLRFSGGQRQRLGLARAILRDPSFLMLDEAMSALDADLETRIRTTINERFAGRTILIITHSDAALEQVDNQVHLVDGRVRQP